MTALSICIPACNEEFLPHTVRDILMHIEGDTEIIVALNGDTTAYDFPTDPRLKVMRNPEKVGQRAAQNWAARQSRAKYVMKIDAHCAVEQGFDRKLMAVMQDDMTVVPVLRNLWVYNWTCQFCGATEYQGPRPQACKECEGDEWEKVIKWEAKTNPTNYAYRFNKSLQFKYFGLLGEHFKGRTGMQEIMSLQGSCFMATRENYWAKELCDESWGSWGQQGSEVALKTWLSGGRVVTCMDTWYAHQFRTKSGDAFPHGGVSKSQAQAREICRDLFLNDKWPKQVRPLVWLLEKFWPDLKRIERNEKDLEDWDNRWQQSDIDRLRARRFVVPASGEKYVRPITRGIIFYTDSELDERIAAPVRERLAAISADKGLPITTAALKRRLAFGAKNIVFPSLKRSHHAMFKQILGALENSTADVVFFCEHDVLYHPSHFDFTPPDDSHYFYNTNVWQVRDTDGHAIYYFCRKLSQMVCYRELAIEHYRKKLAMVEANGGKYDAKLGFEPGTRGTRHGGVDDSGHGDYRSAVPNIDIRHSRTLSKTKWSPDEFRNPANNIDWTEADSVPGWPPLAEVLPLEYA